MSDDNLVHCPGCQAEYDATGYDPGDRFQCPACQEIVTVGGEAPAAAAGAPKVAKMPSRGTTRRSRPMAPPRERTTSKMRVVNDAVGMGALNPNLDPKAARRGVGAPPAASQGPDKTMMIVAAVVGGIMILGAVIYLAKQPSKEDKKKAAVEAARKEQEKKNKEAADKPSSGTSGDPVKPRVNDVPGSTKEMADAVSQALSVLKGHAQDAVFWKMSVGLLKYGPPVIGELIERFNDSDPNVGLAARAIIVRATKIKSGIPEEPFATAAERERIKADVYGWWLDAMRTESLKLVSEADYLEGTGATPDPGPGPGPGPGPKPDGVGGPPKPVGGGTSEAAMRRDLPQHLANYATGTGEQRDQVIAEVRKYGKAVIPALIGYLKSEDYGWGKAANSLLEQFTKQQMGTLPSEGREAFIKKWEDWWTANQATFSM